MDSLATKKQHKKRKIEKIDAFKKELKALAFEPIYGNSIKEIVTYLTIKIQEIAEEYGYKVEFPEEAEVEIEGEVYYFNYIINIHTKTGKRKVNINVQYIMYDEGRWMGMITEVK